MISTELEYKLRRVMNKSNEEVVSILQQLDLSAESLLFFYCRYARLPDINESTAIRTIGAEAFCVIKDAL